MEDLFSVQKNVYAFARGLLRIGEKQKQERGMGQEEESWRPQVGECAAEKKQQAKEKIGWTGDMEGCDENAEENGKNK